MQFTYQRTVRFADTDAAGVVYFANLLKICHEAYEESLLQANFELKSFFASNSLAIPIIHAQIDFLAPVYCGDRLTITLSSKTINHKTFELDYRVVRESLPVARAQTRHICIEPASRKTKSLPETVIKWLDS